MRTDVRYDRKQVYCPNVSLIGFNRWKARKGYFVVWNDNGRYRLARVAGRVAYAPEVGSKENNTYEPSIRNWLVLVVLSTDATSTFIRWAPPEEIVECYSPEDYAKRIADRVARFTSTGFMAQGVEAICSEVAQG